jgi:uncharacterized protein YlxW (UPF0749 family)
MPVSAATETKLREALHRLLGGTPQRTDGALTKENLAREAAVSHATVHRAETILGEWNALVEKASTRSADQVRRDDAIAELRTKLREANQKITTLNGRLDALAAVTANLYRENQTLRRELGSRTRLAVLPTQTGP